MKHCWHEFRPLPKDYTRRPHQCCWCGKMVEVKVKVLMEGTKAHGEFCPEYDRVIQAAEQYSLWPEGVNDEECGARSAYNATIQAKLREDEPTHSP